LFKIIFSCTVDWCQYYVVAASVFCAVSVRFG